MPAAPSPADRAAGSRPGCRCRAGLARDRGWSRRCRACRRAHRCGAPARCAGLGPDERHMGDALVMRRALQQQLMVAEEIAVVGGEDHDGVVGQPARRQRSRARGRSASSIIAIMPQLSAIASRASRSLTAKAACSDVSALPLSRCASAQATGRASGRLPEWKLGGSAMSCGTIHRPVASGRRERMMRVGKRRHQEERLVAARPRRSGRAIRSFCRRCRRSDRAPPGSACGTPAGRRSRAAAGSCGRAARRHRGAAT